VGRVADLFWPGDERAGDLFTSAALLRAMVRVEEEWLGMLVAAGAAPAEARTGLDGLVSADDLPAIAAGAEGGANPVIGLVKLLRSRLGEGAAATWLHKGLTSQDVLDTALVLCLRDTVAQLERSVAEQAVALAGLAREHRAAVMPGRTLGQHAVPITFGLKAAGWLEGLGEATRRLRAATDELPVQVGGAAGTLAAVLEVGGTVRSGKDLADRLGLSGAWPWHTSRGAITAAADALVGLADVWGRVGGEVALLSRPEIGELAEPTAPGRGGSSTMPHKTNPVLSVLLRRHAMTAPQQAATLHLAAGSVTGERPEGAWHAEWDALRALARHSAVAAAQAAELLGGLRVDTERMRTNCSADLLAEQHSLTDLSGHLEATAPEEYLGATDALIDAALEHAARVWKELA